MSWLKGKAKQANGGPDIAGVFNSSWLSSSR